MPLSVVRKPDDAAPVESVMTPSLIVAPPDGAEPLDEPLLVLVLGVESLLLFELELHALTETVIAVTPTINASAR
jgi:hypothetical protein